MNSACPSCGAVYAVTSKDVGRKIKCKKCASALRVDDDGLVADDPAAAPPPVPAAVVGDDDAPPRRSRPAGRSAATGGGIDLLARVGGLPTFLFAVGTVLVLYFFFQSALSAASARRADGALDRVKLERDIEVRKLREGKDLDGMTPEARTDFEKDVAKKTKDINRKYERPLNEAVDDKEYADIAAKRSPLLDNFGLMVGFMVLAVGCLATVRADAPLVVRVVAGAILTGMMMAVFGKFSGCQLR
ncbi:MAG: hypothetical protein C0501_23700 [Isosphaera sp.]|nr:hypothetical protein [Isosphaera sp.]